MNPHYIALVLLPFLSTLLPAAELVPIAKQFVAAVAKLDNEKLSEIYADGPTKQDAIKALAEAAPTIESGKLKIGAIDKELIIGDLGVTLTRLESTDPPKVGYKPLIFVKVSGVWKVFPWATQSDLNALADQRTPEERIHLQLFNKWTNLMEDLLDEEAEQPADGNPPKAPQPPR